ncbi:MAG TPA: MFS transporter [Vicinamibacterales bacterium]|nr:MFS transporter [Vicinamibacterales bacterium]
MRRPPTLPIVLAGFAAFLDLYATQPLLPMLAKVFGASAFAVSLTITAPTVAVAITAPIVGRLADRFGLRRVIVASAAALTVATGLAATSTTLAQLIVWRFLQGVATPGIFASSVAYIHEVWPATHAGRATAAYMSGTIVGGFVGRAVAGLVAADGNWPAVFVVLGILNAIVAVALWRWLPNEASTAKTRKHETHMRELFRNPRLVATFGVGFCVLFTQVAMFTYVTFHLAAPPFNLSTAALGWLFVVYLVGAIVTPVGGRWIDAHGHRVGIGSAMAFGGGGALLTLVPWVPAIVAGLALTATGVFIAQATTSSHIGAVTTQDRALAVGMYSTFYYIGGTAGSALPAALWSVGGWPACVALVVVVQGIGVAIAMAFWKEGRADLSAVEVLP